MGRSLHKYKKCQRRGGLFTTSLQRSAPALLGPWGASWGRPGVPLAAFEEGLVAAALGLGSKMALESALLVLLLLFHGLTHVTLFVVVVGKTRNHAQAADTQPAHARTLTRTEGNGYHQNGYKHHPVAAHFYTLIHTLEVAVAVRLSTDFNARCAGNNNSTYTEWSEFVPARPVARGLQNPKRPWHTTCSQRTACAPLLTNTA